MTVPNARGKPMVVPYDPALMDALRRQQEARARKAEREAMMAGMVALPGGGQETTLREVLESLLKPLQEQLRAVQEAITRSREMLHQMEVEALRRSADQSREEARRAHERAVARREKRLGEYLRVAGNELKEVLQRVGQDVKEGVQDFGDRMTSILATQQVPSRQERLRSLPEMVAIMEAEDRFLQALQGARAVLRRHSPLPPGQPLLDRPRATSPCSAPLCRNPAR